VILDLAMTGVDGFDVLLAMRNESPLRAIPVIVITSDGQDQSLARSFGYGADGLVVKPFALEDPGMRASRLLPP
jgi:CheY-like chemotaxis protein